MSFMWWALLCSYAFIGLLFFALFYIADRADSRRRRISTIGVDRSALPVAQALRGVNVPTAWRNNIKRKSAS